MTLSKTAAERLIKDTYIAVESGLNPFTKHVDRAFKSELKAVKDHRRFTGVATVFSDTTTAKFFIAKWVLYYTYINPTKAVAASDILVVRPAVLYCIGLAAEYNDRIKAAISEEDARFFLDNLEYPFSEWA